MYMKWNAVEVGEGLEASLLLSQRKLQGFNICFCMVSITVVMKIVWDGVTFVPAQECSVHHKYISVTYIRKCYEYFPLIFSL